jgi:prevent-host-death family protein
MTQIHNVHAAKTHLSRLVERAAGGEEIIIAKAGKPMARLVPLDKSAPLDRPLGRLAGKIRIPEDFDAPLTDEMLDAFHL